MENSDKKIRSNERPKIGVVTGSGGIKGMATIALFEFLDKAQIDVDLLIGCSGGSIFAGLWAVGNNAAQIREISKSLWTRKLFAKIDYRTLLHIAGLPFGRFSKSHGLIKPDVVHKTFKKVYGDWMIEDLPRRTMFQATDVFTGEPVMLYNGRVREAIYASGALFPLMPPFKINGKWLMDGVYSSPLPILEAVNEGMDVIIAMSYEVQTTEESKGFVPYFMRCVAHSHQWLQRHQATLSVDLHHHEIIFINVIFDKFMGLRSVHRIPEIIEAGEKAVNDSKEEILKAIENFSKKK
jgi:NTE family protein